MLPVLSGAVFVPAGQVSELYVVIFRGEELSDLLDAPSFCSDVSNAVSVGQWPPIPCDLPSGLPRRSPSAAALRVSPG